MNQEMRFWLVFVRDHRVLTFASGRLLRTLHYWKHDAVSSLTANDDFCRLMLLLLIGYEQTMTIAV